MSRSYNFNDQSNYRDELDEAAWYGYEVKNLHRQKKKTIRKFKDNTGNRDSGRYE